MNQVGNFGGSAKELVHAVHDTAVGFGLTPVPTMIIVGLAGMFALIGLVVGGHARGRTPRHSHRA